MATVEERLAALEEKVGKPDEELYNSRHTGIQLDDAVTFVLNNEKTWSGKAEKGDATTLVLSKADWDETYKTQTLFDPLLEASNAYRYLVGSTTNDSSAYGNAGIKADDIITTGQILFRCEIPPEVDLTVEIVRLEVKA